MSIYEVINFNGGIADLNNRGVKGTFKFGSGMNIRKPVDSMSANQALKEEGLFLQGSSSVSPSSSKSPSSSSSPSSSPSISPSSSASPSGAGSPSTSPSASPSPSSSLSPSASISPSSSVSPSPSPSAGYSTLFQDLIHFWVKCSDGNTYGFGNTGKIYKRTPEGKWSVVYDMHKQIKGAFEKPSSSKLSYLLFATDTELHIKPLPGLSNWSDVDKTLPNWPKTNLTSADWHTMNNVGGDILLANGPVLAMAAYDDSYTNEALDLIPGNIAKTLVERSGRAIVGTFKEGDPTQGINAAIDSEVPLAQVGTDGQIVYADMASSVPGKRFPGGGQVNPGGVANLIEQVNFFEWEQDALSWINKQVVGNLALFGVYNAETGKNGVYSYGRINKNLPFALNLEYEMDVDEIGAITVVNGLVMASYRLGSVFGVRIVDPNAKATVIYEGLDFYSKPRVPALITTYKYTELYFAPLPQGVSIEFWYRMNKNGNFVQAKVANIADATQFNTTGARKAIFTHTAEGEIFEPRVVLNPSGNTNAEVYRMRTFIA